MKHASLPIAVLNLIACALGLVARAADAVPAVAKGRKQPVAKEDEQ
jgi:hypothetical protein